MTDGREDAAQPRAAASVASVASVVAVVAVAVLVLLVAVWAATSGPDDPLRGEGISPDRISTGTPSQTESPKDDETSDESASERESDSSLLITIVGLLVVTVGVLLALGLLYLLGTALWRLRLVRWRRRERAGELPPLDPVHAVASAMLADAGDHEDLLTSGTPRNAVVQSWHRFEVQAERAGVPRKSWETSAEFTLRLLELVEADATAVARLAELYREARFSEHDLGEEARVAALEIVRTIHRDLRTLLSGGRL